jgi:pimeloyl-ACP methyl ester carboxylesterase
MSTSVVLVHGAWHGSWCFDRVMPLLAEAGVPAIAIDLPGHGSDPGPFTDLHGDAARVMETLDRLDGDAVLLGHSYGGAVITEAGVHPSVTHLVYLCALVLAEDETAAAPGSAEVTGLSYEGRPKAADGLIFHPDGTSTLAAPTAAACLYNDCDSQTVTWCVSQLGPQPMENFNQNPAAVAWKEQPSTYVVCSGDLIIHPGLQAVLATRCTHSHTWPTGHSPFVSHPTLLASLLVTLAASTET